MLWMHPIAEIVSSFYLDCDLVGNLMTLHAEYVYKIQYASGWSCLLYEQFNENKDDSIVSEAIWIHTDIARMLSPFYYTNDHSSHNLRDNRTIMGLHRQLYLPSCLRTNGALIRLHFFGMRLDAYWTNGNDREI